MTAGSLTVVLHAELLPVDGPLGGDFRAGLQMLHLRRGGTGEAGLGRKPPPVHKYGTESLTPHSHTPHSHSYTPHSHSHTPHSHTHTLHPRHTRHGRPHSPG